MNGEPPTEYPTDRRIDLTPSNIKIGNYIFIDIEQYESIKKYCIDNCFDVNLWSQRVLLEEVRKQQEKLGNKELLKG